MPHTAGPWTYDESTHHIVSTVEFEEWSLDIEDEPPVPKRIICTYGVMGDNNQANLKLMIAAPQMFAALEQWKCPACGGSGIYQDKGFRGANKKVFIIANVPCKKCGGNGLHPIANAALVAAGATTMSESKP